MKFLLQLFLVTSLLFLANVSLAGPDSHERREYGAHEHGVAVLTLALADHDLAVEFESPAVNLLGFEHAASSDKDRQAVAQAVQRLRAPLTFLNLPSAAQCSVTKAMVESEQLGNATAVVQHNETNEHKHEGHADFTAKYQLQCKAPQALEIVGVKLFETFNGIEKIKAQWLTANGQSAKVLTPSDPMIHLQ